MRQSETDMTELIFAATERLMARDGLNNLSMHKIAKEAKISAGTIYLYFRNKDELFEQFAYRVFAMFMATLEKDYDETMSFFEQYRRMWWNIWYFLKEHPTILTNLNQYQSLPNFIEVCKKMTINSRWELFCKKAQQAGILAILPNHLLFLLSLKSAVIIASELKFFDVVLTEDILESIIERSWRAIQK